MVMNEQEKQQSNGQPVQEPQKELTEQQRQQRRKMIVFSLMLLVFAGGMWLIFAPSGKEATKQQSGLNTDLPTPERSGIVADKRDAYQQDAIQTKRQEKMRSLEEYAFTLGDGSETKEEHETHIISESMKYDQASAHFGGGSNEALHSSVGAYRDLNRQLGSFYEESEAGQSDKEIQLQERIEQLEAQLQDGKTQQEAEQQQLALIEKSYQIAAKYMNGGQNDGTPRNSESMIPGKKTAAQPVGRVRHNVVSLLAAPISDSVFMEEFVKPRNWGFNTVVGSGPTGSKNSIAACVYRTMTVTDGKEVPLRITEPMTAGGILIPANTVLTGTARIDGERMSITISAVQYGGNVIPVELLVYDTDGGEGISVPSSDEINAVKEIAANAGSGLGSSITITDDAGTQLLSDLGRSVIQGTAQYIGQKMRQVKVTLKAGYRVLLLPPLE